MQLACLQNSQHHLKRMHLQSKTNPTQLDNDITDQITCLREKLAMFRERVKGTAAQMKEAEKKEAELLQEWSQHFNVLAAFQQVEKCMEAEITDEIEKGRRRGGRRGGRIRRRYTLLRPCSSCCRRRRRKGILSSRRL